MTDPQKIKIAFLMPHIIMGGVETVLLRLITGLQKNSEYDISVITKKIVTEKFFLDYFHKNNISLIQFHLPSVPKDKNFIIKFVSRLSRSLIKKKIRKELSSLLKQFDVLIDFHNLSFLNDIHSINAKKIGWMHFNSDIYEKHFRNQQDKIFSTYEKVICLTQSFYEYFIDKDKQWINKLVQIYNPIYLQNIIEKSNSSQHPNLTKKYFTFVARIDGWQKDHLTVIQAFELLAKRYPDAKIYFIGDGPFRSLYEKKVKSLGLEENIIFTGTLENPFPYMRNACANILSSHYEGLPTVLLESACLQTLNVASDILGSNEVLLNGKAGILFPTGNAEYLAEILSDIWTDKIDASEMIKNATQSLDRFNEDTVISQVKTLISTCLNEN